MRYVAKASTVSAAATVVVLCLLAHVAGAVPINGQQDAVHARYDEAVKVFQSEDQFRSIALFQHVIDELSPDASRLTADLRRVLLRSLCFRAEALLNAEDQTQAVADLRKALVIDPDIDIDRSLSSPRFVALFDEIAAAELGVIRVDVSPPGAQIYLDGKPFGSNTTRRIAPGSHIVRAESQGFRPESHEVTIAAGTVRAVKLQLQPTSPPVAPPPSRQPTVEPVPQPAAPEPLSRDTGSVSSGPPRRVMVRLDGVWGMEGPAWSSSAVFSLYNKNGYADSEYVVQDALGGLGYEVGGWVRVIGPLIVGASRARSTLLFDAHVEYSVPDARPNYSSRSLAADISDITRTINATHVDIGVTGGGPNFEVAVYAGPSRATITQAVITSGVFREDSGHVTLSRALYRDFAIAGQSGWSLGGEAAYLFGKYFGLGASFRYASYNAVLPDVGTAAFPLHAGCLTFGGGGRIRF